MHWGRNCILWILTGTIGVTSSNQGNKSAVEWKNICWKNEKVEQVTLKGEWTWIIWHKQQWQNDRLFIAAYIVCILSFASQRQRFLTNYLQFFCPECSSAHHRPALSEVFVSDVLVAEKWECTLRQPGTFLSAAVCTLPRHTTRESELDQSPLVRSARQRVRKKLRPQRQESTKRQWRWLKCKKQHWAERNLRVFNKVWVKNMFVAWKLNFSFTSLLRSCNFWVQ